jgi:hypothetical protein
MDYNLETRRNRFGRMVRTLVVIPDADISEAEQEQQSPEEQGEAAINSHNVDCTSSEETDEEGSSKSLYKTQFKWKRIRKPSCEIPFQGGVENFESEIL